tara:strand:+ start:13464 stop:13769 length:306 start_codon:yes stop_codon:yes gene_type:complete
MSDTTNEQTAPIAATDITHIAIPLAEVQGMVGFINANVPTGMGQVLLRGINTGIGIRIGTPEAPLPKDPGLAIVKDDDAVALPVAAQKTINRLRGGGGKKA